MLISLNAILFFDGIIVFEYDIRYTKIAINGRNHSGGGTTSNHETIEYASIVAGIFGDRWI